MFKAFLLAFVAVLALWLVPTEKPTANAAPSFVVTERLPATVKPAVLTPKVKHDIKPAIQQTTRHGADKADSPRGQSLSGLESQEVADILPADPVQATEVAVAKAAPVKAAAKMCCEDCNCRGECNCSYPGECLINSAKPKNCKVIVQQCYGRFLPCQLRAYFPRVNGVALTDDQVAGTWKVFRTDRPHHWDRTEYTPVFRKAAAALTAPVQWVFGNTFRGCAGGNCRSCR